ncbi:MAG: class I SAM-dependent methyltransferase, partial [Acidobacteria bacterium]|nr:class I SAM-dependent methyltransferase [Acidobacteriota bacterium]
MRVRAQALSKAGEGMNTTERPRFSEGKARAFDWEMVLKTKSATTAAYIHGTDTSEQARLTLLNRLTNEPFIKFLELDERASVLEVGSGLGILAREIAERAPLGEIWGVEYSADQLSRARDSVEVP